MKLNLFGVLFGRREKKKDRERERVIENDIRSRMAAFFTLHLYLCLFSSSYLSFVLFRFVLF